MSLKACNNKLAFKLNFKYKNLNPTALPNNNSNNNKNNKNKIFNDYHNT